jgi:hypothetical protein
MQQIQIIESGPHAALDIGIPQKQENFPSKPGRRTSMLYPYVGPLAPTDADVPSFPHL